jgi:hypothetical protein
LKSPAGSDPSSVVRDAMLKTGVHAGVAVAPDIDPLDLM